MFNEMFSRLCKIKENEMDLIAQKNARLQTIHMDINLLEELNAIEMTKFNSMPLFEYADDEMSWSTFAIDFQFLDEENKIDSVDASKSNISREQTFHVRALNDMMNGTIEVHWEDELKKVLAKPICLLKNQTEIFSDVEMEQISKYRRKLKKLQSDRMEFIKRLFNEKVDLEIARDRQVKKLNKCIENLIKSKVHAHVAISSRELDIAVCFRDWKKYVHLCKMEQNLM